MPGRIPETTARTPRNRPCSSSEPITRPGLQHPPTRKRDRSAIHTGHAADHRAYTYSDDGNRRLAKQAFYRLLEIPDDEQLRPRLAEPFATIVGEAARGHQGATARQSHQRPAASNAARIREIFM